MWTAGNSITNSDDTIDSRDVIARIEELEAEREALIDAVNEALHAVKDAEAAVDLAHDDQGQTDEEMEAASEGPGCDLDNAVEELHAAEEELSDWDSYKDCGLELAKLKEFAEEVESQGVTTEWEDGAYFIRDSYFEEHAQEEAESCCEMPDNGGSNWPYCCIDWEKAADMLKMDYSCVEFDGEDYYVRSC